MQEADGRMKIEIIKWITKLWTPIATIGYIVLFGFDRSVILMIGLSIMMWIFVSWIEFIERLMKP